MLATCVSQPSHGPLYRWILWPAQGCGVSIQTWSNLSNQHKHSNNFVEMHLFKCKDMQRIIQLTSNFYNRVHWFISDVSISFPSNLHHLLQALAWGSSPLTSLANLMCQVHEELWPHDRLWQPQYATIAKFARHHNIQCSNTTCGNQCGNVSVATFAQQLLCVGRIFLHISHYFQPMPGGKKLTRKDFKTTVKGSEGGGGGNGGGLNKRDIAIEQEKRS